MLYIVPSLDLTVVMTSDEAAPRTQRLCDALHGGSGGDHLHRQSGLRQMVSVCAR